MGGHEHELEQVPEAGLDGPLVGRLRLDRVGHRPGVRNADARVGEDGPGRVTVALAGRLELLERAQAGVERRHLALAGSQVGAALLALDAGPGEGGLARGPGGARLLHREVRPPQRLGELLALRGDPLHLDAQVARLRVEPRHLAGEPVGGLASALDHVVQGGEGGGIGRHLPPRVLHRVLGRLHAPLGVGERLLLRGEPFGRLLAERFGLGGRRAALVELGLGRGAP